MNKFLFEILVPTVKPESWIGKNRYFSIHHHKIFDKKVREITGGLTILSPAKGYWTNTDGIVFEERMIPVKIMCDKNQIDIIANLVSNHYCQEAVMYWEVSKNVVIKSYKDEQSE